MSGNVLSLLGLALRGRRLAVGDEPVALAVKAGEARLILLASDAAENTLRRGAHLAEEGHCLHLVLPFTKAELGGALGRGSAAIAALTDTGLASAAAQKLAALDPERYGDTAARMERKLQRAKERQAAAPRKKKRPPDEKRRTRPSGRPEERPKEHHPGKKPYSGGRRPDGKPRFGERPSKEPRRSSGRPGGPHSEGSRPGEGPGGTHRADRKPEGRFEGASRPRRKGPPGGGGHGHEKGRNHGGGKNPGGGRR